ncbi:Lateral organ boundaries, LOB [Dillenia turbinata]|uniref:Lateral organ boundaries, LOB n=1 Tax=Dillenia turbinata TaxID=194707 RepID=A0AAN8W680_9MAGN
MTGSGSPCGACKFLRRKCVRGCVFAPYFCHEQGATHFAAIHKVFGASNVSKLLAHLPVSDRCEAAVTISYEAQARLQDPIYGCVSHIFALQQQVVNLQEQLASLKEQAAQSLVNGSNHSNPVEKLYGKHPSYPVHDAQSLFQLENSNMPTQFNVNFANNAQMMMPYMDPSSSLGNYENSFIPGNENVSFSSFEEGSPSMASFDMQTNTEKWDDYQDPDDLLSLAFGYVHHS